MQNLSESEIQSEIKQLKNTLKVNANYLSRENLFTMRRRKNKLIKQLKKLQDSQKNT